MYYWYVAHKNELFCDLDCKDIELKRLQMCIERLRGAKESGTLDWDSYFPYQSESVLHYHMMIKLTQPMENPYYRILWESRFLDDSHRNDMNFARLLAGGESWSLLITPQERRSYWRPFDYSCSCRAKHKAEIMRDCPVAQHLKCTLAADHFGKPVKTSDKPVLGRGSQW